MTTVRDLPAATAPAPAPDWACVFCTTTNVPTETHCVTCGLSRRNGTRADFDVSPRPSLSATRSPVAEVGVALGLLVVWKLADVVAGAHSAGAVDHGRSVWSLERSLHLPSEAALQRPLLGHRSLLHLLDGYYAVGHLGGMVVLALWLYLRHREQYGDWRNRIVVATGTAFAVQLWSVAPPRSVPGLGVVDTARLLGESVYAHARFANQVSSLPSVHALWALLVAVAVVRVSRSRWRWLAVAHPVVTVAAVVLTGNHYWLDIVAAAVLALPVVAIRRAAGR